MWSIQQSCLVSKVKEFLTISIGSERFKPLREDNVGNQRINPKPLALKSYLSTV